MTSEARSIDPVKGDKRGTNIPLNQLDRGTDKDMKDTTPLMFPQPANESESGPKEDLKTFVRKHFHRKECSNFVQNQEEVKDPPRCKCGEIRREHVGVQREDSVDGTKQDKVPKEAQENLPNVSWDPDSALKNKLTNAYGEINFINVERVGGKNPAKYIRISDKDSVKDLIQLMIDYWKIMEPKRPDLVISVIGGAKNFKLDGRMRDTFSTGLIKAAKSTSAWLISSGFNVGLMKAVGQAVRQAQSFVWDHGRIVHELKCIGFAPWGCVRNRRYLENPDENGEFCADYRTTYENPIGEPMPLNPDFTHFIFVDDGYRNRYKGNADVRASFEQHMINEHSIPVVLVVVEGGTSTIDDVKKSLEHDIPVVVCSGTGRAADILSYAYSHTENGQKEMKEKHVLKLNEKIFDTYKKNWKKWKENDIDEKRKDLTESVKFCCRKAQLMTVFSMNKHEDLDLAILTALLKANTGKDENKRRRQLKLALTWNKVDIAQEEIFREDVQWAQGILYEVLTNAILEDKVDFMKLILQQGVLMEEFLTVNRMETLISNVQKPNQIYTLMNNLFGHEELDRGNVLRLTKKLLGRYDDSSNMDAEEAGAGIEETDVENRNICKFKRPYKQLMIWAVLLHKQKLAKYCWEMGDEPITSALSATKLYSAIAKNIGGHKSILKNENMQSKLEFESLATRVLDECHQKNPNKATLVLMRKTPCWNETCLQIAASANDQMFLSSEACMNTIDSTWKDGALASIKNAQRKVFEDDPVGENKDASVLGEKKIPILYISPKSKFFYRTIVYIAFLLLHSYMVLVDFKPDHVTPIEIVCNIWTLAFLVDDFYANVIHFPAPTFMSFISKILDWYGIVTMLDFLNYLLCFVGFFIHIFTAYYMEAKVIYCVNAVIFYERIMKVYTASPSLGPKLVMIKRMLGELLMFIMVLIVFLLAYGISSQALLYHSRSPTWNVLKDVFYFPYWQLYGELFLEEWNTDSCTEGATDCRTYHWLVPVLQAAYLLVGNILLLNLLIAIFSHVFNTIEQNSIEIWKYQMYFLVVEYDKKTAFVPPFSLVVHIILFFKWLVLKICRRNRNGSKNDQTFAEIQLEYLQLFEKEMTANCLRRMKEREKSGVETTVSMLQKRVDELTQLIEDEVIRDNSQILVDHHSMPVDQKKKADGIPSGAGTEHDIFSDEQV